MSSLPENKNLITYEAVSAWTGIKLATLYSLVRRKQIPHIRLGKRLVRFDPDLLGQWLAEGTVSVSVSDSEAAQG